MCIFVYIQPKRISEETEVYIVCGQGLYRLSAVAADREAFEKACLGGKRLCYGSTDGNRRPISGWLVVKDEEGEGFRPTETEFYKSFEELGGAFLVGSSPYAPEHGEVLRSITRATYGQIASAFAEAAKIGCYWANIWCVTRSVRVRARRYPYYRKPKP